MRITDAILLYIERAQTAGRPMPTTVLLGPTTWKQFVEEGHAHKVQYNSVIEEGPITVALVTGIENHAIRYLVDLPA